MVELGGDDEASEDANRVDTVFSSAGRQFSRATVRSRTGTAGAFGRATLDLVVSLLYHELAASKVRASSKAVTVRGAL